MSDVFGRRDQVLAGALSSDGMFLTWPELVSADGGLGLLVQNVGLGYQQPIRRIFEIGPGVIPIPIINNGVFEGAFAGGSAAFCDNPGALDADLEGVCETRTQPTYYIVGRPEGRLQFSNYVGPNALTAEFYAAYGSPCGQNFMTLSGQAGCAALGGNTGVQMSWSLSGVVLDSLNMGIGAQEMVIQTSQTAMFAGLSLTVD